MQCWADEDDIVCVHPNGPRLLGHQAIRESFEGIFEAGGLDVRIVSLYAVSSLASVVHNLVEEVRIQSPQGLKVLQLVTSNVYHHTAQGWRLVLHHASMAAQAGMQEPAPNPTMLH